MTDITPQRIAKLAEWAGLEGVRVVRGTAFASHEDGSASFSPEPPVVVYDVSIRGANSIIPRARSFNPINNPADAWMLLERAITAGFEPDFWVELDWRDESVYVCVLNGLNYGRADNPREAFCLALLDMIGDE